MHSEPEPGAGLDPSLMRETWSGNESAGWWQRRKRTMGGSVMRTSRRKYWNKSQQNPESQAAGGERGVGGSSRQISEARGKSTQDLFLQ